MTDYINREDAINTIRNTFTGMTADTLELRINDIPSADVAPVRHGRWDEKRFRTIPHNRISKAKKCSECGKRKDKYVTWIYCPNCGAKMEEGNEAD